MIFRMSTVLNSKIFDHQCISDHQSHLPERESSSEFFLTLQTSFGVRSGIPKDVCGEANRNLALLHLRVLLLPFIALLQNKHTTLAENDENLISAQLRISAHSKGLNI